MSNRFYKFIIFDGVVIFWQNYEAISIEFKKRLSRKVKISCFGSRSSIHQGLRCVDDIFIIPVLAYSHYMPKYFNSCIIFDLSTCIMNRAAVQVSNSLVMITRARFSKLLRDRESNPIKERVMSTPTWPVPYYQRIHRAYPVRCNPKNYQRIKRH